MIESHISLPSKLKVVSQNDFSGTYEIEGLHPGYGQTLGNSLRRIILSSLLGVAITSIKIEGAEHEFSTLPGVKEDMIMVILNLKKIRFNFADQEPKKITLSVKGSREVTASDIETGGLVEILNKTQHIATLTEKNSSLNVEMTLEKGLGYLPKESMSREKNEVGLIFVDAAFTPVSRISYEVENMRVGDRTNYNRLRLHIETDGTLTPAEALQKSIEIMITQLRSIADLKEDSDKASVDGSDHEDKIFSKEEAFTDTEEQKGQDEALKTRIDDLNLSSRISRALTTEGIRTVGGLARKKEEDLKKITGLGEKGVTEIKKALNNLGITLK